MNKKVKYTVIAVFVVALLTFAGIYGKYKFERGFDGEFSSLPFYFNADCVKSSGSTSCPTITFVRTEEDGDDDEILTDVSDFQLAIKNNNDTEYNDFETTYEITVVDSDKFAFSENNKTVSKVTKTISGNDIVNDIISLKLKIINFENPQKEVTIRVTSTKPYSKYIDIKFKVVQEGAIQTIEDLLDLSIDVSKGKNLTEKFKLTRNLDFEEPDSYDDDQRTDYEDVNNTAGTEPLIIELTNIDGSGFIPIGTSSNYFQGKFEGGGYTLSNLYIANELTGSNRIGLFGYVQDIKVSNLTITGNIDITKNAVAAGLMSQAYGEISVTNVVNEVKVTSTYKGSSVGGIVGNADANMTMKNCINKGDISGSNNAGGIAGYVGTNVTVTLESCHNEGKITNDRGPQVGGLIGRDNAVTSTTIIKKSYNDGEVVTDMETEDNAYAGGLIGLVNGTLEIEDSYNLKDVTNKKPDYSISKEVCVGGLVGASQATSPSITINNSHNEGDISNGLSTGGLVGQSSSTITLNNSYNEGKVTNTTGAYIGGLIGKDVDKSSITTIKKSHNNGEIISDKDAAGELYAGGLTGAVHGKIEITDSYNLKDVTNKKPEYSKDNKDVQIGGLVGGSPTKIGNDSITIKNSYNKGNISYGNSTGGLVGHSYSTIVIKKSHNEGIVTNGDGAYLGGLIGKDADNNSHTTITDSYNAGKIVSEKTNEGEISVGGLFGLVHGHISLNNVYNVGDIENTTSKGISIKTGGLIGYKSETDYNIYINNSYNEGNITVTSADNPSETTDFPPGSQQGGLIGLIDHGNLLINKSHNKGHIKVESYVESYTGGLVGMSKTYDKTYYIINSYNSGSIEEKSEINESAGIIPYNANAKTMIINSFNAGDISSNDGAVGIVKNSNGIVLNNVYNIGKISGDNSYSLGEFTDLDIIENSYYYGDNGSNIDQGTSMSLNDMQKQAFADELLNNLDTIKVDEIDQTLSGYRLNKWNLGQNYPIFADNETTYTGAEMILSIPNGLNNQVEGGMYRFQGACSDDKDCEEVVDNYVCFGTTNVEECLANQDQYMYRIIGIDEETHEIKLLKKNSLNSTSYWNSDYESTEAAATTWPLSFITKQLNGVTTETTLDPLFVDNSEYSYINKNGKWYNLIAEHKWYYGDMDSGTNGGANQDPSEVYKIESGQANATFRTNSSTTTSGKWVTLSDEEAKDNKISLMYLSDYNYSGAKGGINCYNRDNSSKCMASWITSGSTDSEWTMTRLGWNSSSQVRAYLINNSNGYIANGNFNSEFALRPVFYINATTVLNGDGTISSPFMIELND